MPRPSPRLPLVTMTLRMAGELARGADLKRRHEMDRRRHLVTLQRGAAEFEEFAFQFIGLFRRDRFRLDHDIGNDDSAGDRVAPGLYQRHPDAGMAVDRGLDLFGMYLEAADID